MPLGVRYTSLLVTKGFTDIDQHAREADKLHDMVILQDLRYKKKERAEANNINVIGSRAEMQNINEANLKKKNKMRRTMFKLLLKDSKIWMTLKEDERFICRTSKIFERTDATFSKLSRQKEQKVHP